LRPGCSSPVPATASAPRLPRPRPAAPRWASAARTAPIGRALGDARLLQYHLAQPDDVRVARMAPGQVASVGVIPGQQGVCQCVAGPSWPIVGGHCPWGRDP
jgi:hypothetical protein